MSTWFMTVGYPGGDFASTSPEELLSYMDVAEEFYAGALEALTGGRPVGLEFGVVARIAPPDLMEWLEHDRAEIPIEDNRAGSYRWKRPGGWLETVHDSNEANIEQVAVAAAFIPVEGAAGITILEGGSQ